MADALKGMELLDLGALLGAVAVANNDVHAIGELATMHAAHGDTAGIVAIIERGDKHLRSAFELLRSRNNLHNLIEQIVDVVGGLIEIGAHPSVLGRTIDHGEIELVLGGVEVAHQVEHHLVHGLRAAVGLVDLVDHHDGLQTNLQGFLQHETRLRHRTLECVDKQQTTIRHVQHALHLTTEIGVARSIENIDFDALPVDGDVLRQNGYPSFALQIIGIEHFAAVVLAVTEQFSSEHHLVDQGSLTMVNVRNNCDVTNVLH